MVSTAREVEGRIPIRRALISVSDKRGVLELALALGREGVKLVSTGGTARALREAGVVVDEVSELTGSREILDGRVKTLHPRVHAGILYRRDREEDVHHIGSEGIPPIDMVVVNLYPFEAAIAREGVTLDDALETIDVGGPTMLRAAAKNWPHVVALCDPDDYAPVIAELREGGVTAATRRALAARAFARTQRYDRAIAGYLGALDGGAPAWKKMRAPDFVLDRSLRYGENPHQPAAFFRPGSVGLVSHSGGVALAGLEQPAGKETSYNNLLDLDAGWRLAQALGAGAAVVIKHRNPCGAATGDDLLETFRSAWAGDSLSAFGGVVVLRGRVSAPIAEAIAEHFVEVVAAEGFDDDALERLRKKKRLTLLSSPGLGSEGEPMPEMSEEVRSVAGGELVQASDRPELADARTFEVVTKRAPTDAETRALRFAWQVVRYVQSNAIVFANGTRTVGVGSGQTSRVDAVNVAIMKAGREGHSLQGSVMASDAFFPFGDSVEAAARVGATAVIQPGGSKKDRESIEAADAAGMAMVFTERRCFRH